MSQIFCGLRKLSPDLSSPKIEEAATGESDFESLEVHSFSMFSVAVNPFFEFKGTVSNTLSSHTPTTHLAA